MKGGSRGGGLNRRINIITSNEYASVLKALRIGAQGGHTAGSISLNDACWVRDAAPLVDPAAAPPLTLPSASCIFKVLSDAFSLDSSAEAPDASG